MVIGLLVCDIECIISLINGTENSKSNQFFLKSMVYSCFTNPYKIAIIYDN